MNWLKKKFSPAFSGMVLACKDCSIALQIMLACCAVAAGIILRFVWWEWALVAAMIGLVVTAEILNTAIEKICDWIQPGQDERIRMIKDLGAAAVLWASLCAFVVGLLVAGHHLLG